MLKVVLTLIVLASVGLAQSSSDGSFSVRHAKKANFSLSPVQMREAESLYVGACEVVQREVRGGIGELHPHFTVVIGADRNQVHGHMIHGHVRGNAEIWMKKWDATVFAEAVVVLAFDEMLTPDVIAELSNRALRFSNSTGDSLGIN
jgi:hypothetical protein